MQVTFFWIYFHFFCTFFFQALSPMYEQFLLYVDYLFPHISHNICQYFSQYFSILTTYIPGKCALVCATWTSWTCPRGCLVSSGKEGQARQAEFKRTNILTNILKTQAWVSQALNTHWYINHIYFHRIFEATDWAGLHMTFSHWDIQTW